MRYQIVAVLAVATGLCALAGCARSPQAKEAKFLKAGKEQMEKKDYSRAVLYFKNAIRVMPRDAEPYYQLGLAYLGARDSRSAAASFRKATELNAKHEEARLKLTEMMAASSSREVVEEAARNAAEIVASRPENTEALNTLAMTELRLGRPEDAEKHLQEALQRAPASLQSSIALARVKLAGRDLLGAEAVLKRAVEANPKTPEPRVTLAGFYLATRRDAEAEQQLQAALRIDAQNGPALLSLGGLQFRAGQKDKAEATFRQLARRPEKNYKPLHALFLYQTGQRDAAIAELERLAKDDPSDRDMRSRLTAAYLGVKRTADAEKVLSAALEKNPKDIDALLSRSKIYLAGGKALQAQTDLREVVRLRPESADAHYALSKAYQALGDSENRRQELGESLRRDARYVPARLDLAGMLIATKAPKAALALLDEAPPEQRAGAPIRLLRNWALLGTQDQAAARKGIDDLLAAGRSPEALLQDAVLKFDQKDYAAARVSAEEALRVNPDNVRALSLVGQALQAQKNSAGALQRVRDHLEKHPKSPRLQLFLAQTLRGFGKLDEARRAYEAARSLDASLVAADLGLAELDIADGKPDRARQSLTRLHAAHPQSVAPLLLLAGLEGTEGRQAAAIEQYRKVLDRDPRNLAALNNLAYLLVNYSKQPDEAMSYAQQAKEIAPDNPAVNDTLGWIYYQKGSYSAAIKLLESATASESTALHKLHLGMAYVKAGDVKRGAKELEAAVKIDPNLPEAQKALEVVAQAGASSR